MTVDNKLISRRNFLRAGGVLTLAVAGGLIWRADDRGVFSPWTGEAYAPWTTWAAKERAGTPLALVAAGILAANPHDTQPWLFKISANQIDIHASLARHLGSFDPFLREMHMGLGCAIENMRLAAAPNGYNLRIEMMPGHLREITQREGFAHAATLHLSAQTIANDTSPLYDAIPKRHTNRYPYDRTRALPADFDIALTESEALVPDVKLFLYREGDAFEAFAKAIIDATYEIGRDRQMVQDSESWFRDGPAEIEQHRSGLTIDAVGLPPFISVASKMLPRLSPEMAQTAWENQTSTSQVPSAALLGFVAVRDRLDRVQALNAGRVWQHMHLTATAHGIDMHPLNQPIETADREIELGKPLASEARLAAITGDASWQPTFAFRAGYGLSKAHPSPRRALSDVTQA